MTTGTELLVARILQPLARSLEEARRNLTLEVDAAPDDEEEYAAPLSSGTPTAAPADVTAPQGPAHGVSPQKQETSPSIDQLISIPAAMDAASHPPARTNEPANHAHFQSTHDGARPPAPHPRQSAASPVSAHQVPQPTTRIKPVTAPAFHHPPFLRPVAGVTEQPVVQREGQEARVSSPEERSTIAAPTSIEVSAERSTRAPALLRVIPPASRFAADAPSSADSEPSPTPFTTPVAKPAPGTPSQQEAREVPAAPTGKAVPTAPESSSRRPRHWRLKKPLTDAATTPSAQIGDTPEAVGPSQTAAPAPLPVASSSRNAPVGRVADAMAPVLDKAWQLTDSSLRDSDDNPAPAMAAGPRVNNHFHVSVALAGESSAPRDAQELETALIALLRDAARRQGLDV